MKEKLLLNWLYYNPVGHVVEALKVSKALVDANKNLEVSVVLNSATAYELTKVCPWIKKTYIIDQRDILRNGEKANCLKKIPKTWDYVITDNLPEIENKGVKNLGWEEESFLSYLKISEKIFVAKIGKGTFYPKRKLPKGIRYRSDRKIILKLPKSSIKFARKYKHNGKKICIMFGGSAGSIYYPSIKTWEKIINELNKEIPGCKIYLTGVRKSHEGRTATQAYTKNDIDSILKKFNNVVDCYDIGLWNQLALIEGCDIFISPHTGFAFLAPCVNTPWLEIAGGDWPAYLFNDVPFYSVFPDNKEYPYLGKLGPHKYRKSGKIPGMESRKLDKKIPEIIKATKLLLNPKFTYKKSIEVHKQNIKKANIRKKEINIPPFKFF